MVRKPGWGGFSADLDMCEIQVDRGDGKGFVALCFDTTSNYTDTTPFPSAPARWTYQAIYRVGDQRVGQTSGAGSRELDPRPQAERAGSE